MRFEFILKLVSSFKDSCSYGSLPDTMEQTDNRMVIYCIHGKPNGCCATVINDSSKPITSATTPRETITISTFTFYRYFNILVAANYVGNLDFLSNGVYKSTVVKKLLR